MVEFKRRVKTELQCINSTTPDNFATDAVFVRPERFEFISLGNIAAWSRDFKRHREKETTLYQQYDRKAVTELPQILCGLHALNLFRSAGCSVRAQSSPLDLHLNLKNGGCSHLVSSYRPSKFIPLGPGLKE